MPVIIFYEDRHPATTARPAFHANFAICSPSPPRAIRFTLGLVAAIAPARGLDFLSTRLVTPTLALEANPLMRRASWVWMIVTILT